MYAYKSLRKSLMFERHVFDMCSQWRIDRLNMSIGEHNYDGPRNFNKIICVYEHNELKGVVQKNSN